MPVRGFSEVRLAEGASACKTFMSACDERCTNLIAAGAAGCFFSSQGHCLRPYVEVTRAA